MCRRRSSVDHEKHYDTVQTWEQFDAWLEKINAAELTSFDTETTVARSDDRADRGPVVVGRAGPCRLCAGRASRPGRARATAARRSAREAQAVARKRRSQEGRPASEIRRAGAGELRHRNARHRTRHAAAIVRARIASHARHGQPRAAPSRHEDDQVRRGRGQGRVADRLRRSRAGQGRRIRGGRRRHHVASASGAVSASGRREGARSRVSRRSKCRRRAYCARWSAPAC